MSAPVLLRPGTESPVGSPVVFYFIHYMQNVRPPSMSGTMGFPERDIS